MPDSDVDEFRDQKVAELEEEIKKLEERIDNIDKKFCEAYDRGTHGFEKNTYTGDIYYTGQEQEVQRAFAQHDELKNRLKV